MSSKIITLNFVFSFFLVTFLSLQNVLAISCVDVSTQNEIFDQDARLALRKLLKPNDESRAELQKWLVGVDSRLKLQGKTTPLEDLTLQLLIRTNVFPELEVNHKVKELFKASRLSLTGEFGSFETAVNKPLHKSALQNTSLKNRRIYDLAVQVDAETLRIKESWLRTAVGKVAPIGMLAVALTHTGGPIIGGVVFGYFMITLGDLIAHRFILHATPEQRNLLTQFTALDGFTKAALEHEAHHRVLFPGLKPEQYALRFKRDMQDPQVQAELIPLLKKMGMTPEEQKNFVEGSYQGVYVTRKTKIAAMASAGALTAVFGWLIGGGGESSAITAIISTLVSLTYAPFINLNHMPLHDIETQPIEKPTRLMQWYFNTGFYRAIARRHYMHHLRSNSNYAVLPFGFDRLMGTYQPPSLKDILDMSDADLIF